MECLTCNQPFIIISYIKTQDKSILMVLLSHLILLTQTLFVLGTAYVLVVIVSLLLVPVILH